MENLPRTSEIPHEIKSDIISFNNQEVQLMFARLEEIKRLKKTQKERELNTKHLIKVKALRLII